MHEYNKGGGVNLQVDLPQFLVERLDGLVDLVLDLREIFSMAVQKLLSHLEDGDWGEVFGGSESWLIEL